MRGSVVYQVQQIFEKSGIARFGLSRHAAKSDARLDGKQISAAIGSVTGIHSYNTADAYRDVWRQLLRFAGDEYQVKDIERLTAEHVRAFLETKIESGVAAATFRAYAAALGKLETTLNQYAANIGTGYRYQYRAAINATRQEARDFLPRPNGSRAYTDPKALIAAIRVPSHQLVARIQYESGARIHETVIHPEQLCGTKIDKIDNCEKGLIQVKGKGGKTRMLRVSVATFCELSRILQRDGTLQVDIEQYRESLKAAAAASGQEYAGKSTHGLRWNHAREFYAAAATRMSSECAMLELGVRMGHERPVPVYLS